MRKSLGLLMILVSVIAFAFVSCDASTAPVSDKLGEIVVADSQSRGISVTVDNTVNVDELYWYYSASKNGGDIFNTGATNGYVPVKKSGSNPVKGLSEANLGFFSYGNWTFTFYGVKDKIDPVNGKISQINNTIILYSGTQTIDVDKNENFLNLTLAEGDGLTTEIVFDSEEGVWFTHNNIEQGMRFSLSAVDNVAGHNSVEINCGTAEVINGKVSFKGMSFPAETTPAVGAHVLTFTLTQTYGEEATPSVSTVATYELRFTVTKGYTHTIKGDLTSAEVQGEVAVGTYAKSVPATIASLVLPVTLNSSDSSKTVKAPVNQPIEVSTMDLTVKYPNGVKLTTDTNTAGSGNNVTADATIGFELKEDKTGGIEVDTSTQEQTTYELTLNVATTNDVLVEVSKFIGTNLEIEAVYHNSTLVHRNGSEGLVEGEEYYDYNPSDGILKLYVKHASPIDVVTKKVLAVASIGNVNYATVEAALEAAVPGDTILLGVGEYEPFCINKANITVEGVVGATREESTVIKSTDYFVSSSNGLTSGNLTIRATGVTIDSIWFDVTTKQNAGSWTTRGAFFAAAEDATIKNCMIEGSENDPSTASFFYGKKITITGCTFKNFERGIYHMGDNVSDPQFTITNNTFENVLVPFDTYISQPLSSDSVDSYITITGNYVSGDDSSYIQIWDHAQWTKKNDETLSNYAGIKNVTLNNSGNIVYYLTHFNMLTGNSGINVDVSDGQVLKYRSYVEVDSSYVSVMSPNYNDKGNITSYGSVSHGDCSEITDWNEHPFIRSDANYIYTIVPGEYKLLKTAGGDVITDFTVTEQIPGNIQKISKPVISVSSLEELEAALNNLHDGDYISFGANIVQDKVDTTSGQVNYSLAEGVTGDVEITIDLNGFVFDGQWGGFPGVPNLTVNILGVEKTVAEYYKHETGNHMVKASAVFNGEAPYGSTGYQTTVLRTGLFESNNLTVMAYGGKVIIDGAEISNTADGGAIYTCNSPIVEILSGKLSCEEDGALFVLEPYRANEGPEIIIKGGEFDASKAACMLFVNGEDASKLGSVIIEGGNFVMNTNSEDYVFIQSNTDVINKSRLQIKGGTFNINPSEYVAEGFIANNDGRVWTVSATN